MEDSNEKKIFVLKLDGDKESFDIGKLYLSLIKAGAIEEVARKVSTKIERDLKKDISTTELYFLVEDLLLKESKLLSTYYGLSRAFAEIGPDGFMFEKFMARVLEKIGYTNIKRDIVLKGKCVNHEVDLIAEKDGKTIYVECKFHNHKYSKNDVKVALYVHSRSNDLKSNPQNKFDEYWIISNTKFTEDAITYAQCSGLKLLGDNFPLENSLTNLVAANHLFPLTSLKSLKKSEARELMNRNIFLCGDLLENMNQINFLGWSDDIKLSLSIEIETMLKNGIYRK